MEDGGSQAEAEVEAQAEPAGDGGQGGKGVFFRRHAVLLAALLLLAVCTWLFGWKIGDYSLNDPWEPRYPQVVREMLDRGDYITPYHGGEIRWAKPVGFYWAELLPVVIFGNNEFSARLPSVLFGILGVLALFWCLLELRGLQTALIGAFALASMPLYYFMARQAMPDMMMAGSLIASMGFFALGRFGAEGGRRRRFLVAYAFLGLAVLAKGPLAAVLFAGALLMFWLVDLDPARLLSARRLWEDLRRAWRFYHVGWGLLIFAAIALPWYAAIWIQHGSAFVDSFILEHNVDRLTGTAHVGLAGSSAHYLETILHGMYPWLGFAVGALFFFSPGRERLSEEGRQAWYFLSWATFIFVFFTLANTKLDHYILPATAPLAALVALVWERYLARETAWWIRVAFVVALVFTALPIRDFVSVSNVLIMDAFTNKKEIVGVDVETPLLVFLGVWAALQLVAVLRLRSKAIAAGTVACALALAVFFSHHVLPSQEHMRSTKQYVEIFKAESPPGGVMLYYGKIRHTVTYYLGGEDKYIHYHRNQSDDLARYARDRRDVFIIAEVQFASRLARSLEKLSGKRWKIVSRSNPHFALIRNVD
ncbi:MAG: glycosyltransferase family 39 protein [Deltaproteobacteria bacterium]|nr:glycosyltransferase family 39 protein [Deltaproteobacteria bacterium]